MDDQKHHRNVGRKRKMPRNGIVRMREEWTETRTREQDEIDDITAINVCNSSEIAARNFIAGKRKKPFVEIVISVELKSEEHDSKPLSAYARCETVVNRAGGKINWKLDRVLRGSIELEAFTVVVSSLSNLDRKVLTREHREARARQARRINARRDEERRSRKDKRKRRFSFLAAKGVSKL